jgi:hypothetical protein
MQIPNEPVVWVVLIVLVALVLGIAIWRHYSVVVRKGDAELRLERPSESTSAGVTVAEKATIEDAEVGNITGVQGPGEGTPAPSVDVASGARIKKAKVGDITGVVHQPRSGQPRS